MKACVKICFSSQKFLDSRPSKLCSKTKHVLTNQVSKFLAILLESCFVSLHLFLLAQTLHFAMQKVLLSFKTLVVTTVVPWPFQTHVHRIIN